MTTSCSRPTRRSGSWRAVLTVPALAATTLLVPAFASPASAADGDASQQIGGWCAIAPDIEDISSSTDPVSLNVPPAGRTHAGRADAARLDVGSYTDVDWDGTGSAGYEACGTQVDFRQKLTVGAGTSGLDIGDPVDLEVAMSFSGLMKTWHDDELESNAMTNFFAELTITDETAECIPSDEGGGCYPVEVLGFSASGDRTSYSLDNTWSDPDGHLYLDYDWRWLLDSNRLEEPVHDFGQFDDYVCPTFPCPIVTGPDLPSPMDPTIIDTGLRTVRISTTVGATLSVYGNVDTDTNASDAPAQAVADMLDGITTSVAALPGSGVEVLVGTGPFQQVDNTAPTVEVTAAPAPNTAGWNNTDVTVSYAATDEEGGSGVAQIGRSATGAHPIPSAYVPGSSGSDVISTEGVTEVQVAAQDVAGNTSEATTRTVRIDKTAPVVTATAPAPAVAGAEGTAVVEYAASATDALDGAPALSCTSPSGSAFPIGTTPVTCTATDHAGNTAAQSFDVVVTAAPGGGGGDGGDGGELPVPTAAEQVEALTTAVQGMTLKTGVRQSLVAHLKPLQRSLTLVPHKSCAILGKFVKKVEQQAGKGLTPTQLADLRARTAQLATTLGC